TAYAAAKFAGRGFSESLRHELQMANSPVRVLVVHPGGIATDIARNSRTGSGVTDNARRAEVIDRFDKVAKKSPASAAWPIAGAIEANKLPILIGSDAKFAEIIQRLRPAKYWALLGRALVKREENAKPK